MRRLTQLDRLRAGSNVRKIQNLEAKNDNLSARLRLSEAKRTTAENEYAAAAEALKSYAVESMMHELGRMASMELYKDLREVLDDIACNLSRHAYADVLLRSGRPSNVKVLRFTIPRKDIVYNFAQPDF